MSDLFKAAHSRERLDELSKRFGIPGQRPISRACDDPLGDDFVEKCASGIVNVGQSPLSKATPDDIDPFRSLNEEIAIGHGNVTIADDEFHKLLEVDERALTDLGRVRGFSGGIAPESSLEKAHRAAAMPHHPYPIQDNNDDEENRAVARETRLHRLRRKIKQLVPNLADDEVEEVLSGVRATLEAAA